MVCAGARTVAPSRTESCRTEARNKNPLRPSGAPVHFLSTLCRTIDLWRLAELLWLQQVHAGAVTSTNCVAQIPPELWSRAVSQFMMGACAPRFSLPRHGVAHALASSSTAIEAYRENVASNRLVIDDFYRMKCDLRTQILKTAIPKNAVVTGAG